MSKKAVDGEMLWKGRKHWMWFPFSFTSYQLTDDRLYHQTGFFHTHYDEVLLYRVTDLCLERSLLQKLFGTGTLVLQLKADTQDVLKLVNIKKPLEIKKKLSGMVETARRQKGVIGREFYENSAHNDSQDADASDFHNDSADDDGYDFESDND